jgi:hypothetical protein
MKKTINKLFYIASAAGLLLSGSCTKKIDEAFLNPNAQVKQPIETLLPGIIASMVVSNSANGSFYGTQRDATYIGRFIQNFAQNSSGFRNDQMADYFGTGTPDLCGDVWAMHYYGHGQNISRIIEWGTEEKKWDYVGVAHAIRAWGFLTVTDLHADAIIVKEAFRPDLLTFNYNTQEEAYEEVRSLCRTAIDYLSRTGDGVNQANLARGDQFMNGGDVNKWKKFVYGVMARSFHRVTNKSIYSADSVVKYCDLAMQTNAENSNITWSNAGGSGTYSWFSPFRGNIGGLRQGKFIADIMQGINTQFPTNSIDPRAWYIIRENANSTFRGVRPNRGGAGLALGDSCQNFWGGSFTAATASSDAASRYVFKNKAIWPIITASEIQFIKAEALFRKGSKAAALTAYTNAINLHFDQLISTYEESVPAANRITQASRTAYLTNPIIVPPANDLTLSHIMMQKYISLYIWGTIETWVDMRRYHYTDIDPVTTQQVYREFTLPTGVDLWPANLGKPTYRLRPRYNSEYLYNIDALNKVGAFAGDYITQEPWFVKP